jgi:hypothetical protein
MKATGKSSDLYELDFYAWTQEQAKLLQEQKWSFLDVHNLVEEIDSFPEECCYTWEQILDSEFLPGHAAESDEYL